ncbi:MULTISPECIES: hypothetical protein [unclassified Treponema]|uniref:hypothetical protein n=1 Tax=unclassified Treponema TaxID=2638727 RepID=UPI0020A56135|nr:MULTISPECIES: hypothetical protein [unclassified Treponema]UTC67210.1 hypothetical protein E4O06_00610 [Treponema sp. OMZ 789]UTC69939.1 hypothetical protein E4O01_00605 [Treponema sp. OMZ 790]UTC72654.1 hypothetical protein E4O02_00605 [Treponema sp. OMZ 791]
MQKKIYTIIFLIISALILFSCTSYKSEYEKEMPDWIEKVPASSGSYEYFTASGTNKNFTLAETDAKNNLINEIIRYLGVSIKAETTTTALGTIENFERILKSEITQSSSANIKNLKIKNRYIEKKNDSVTVYLLAEYDKNELRKERNRLLKIAEEKILSISEPEKKADDFFSKKKYYSAAVYYCKTAAAALNSGIENYDIKFKQNIEKAKDSLKKIKPYIEKESLENPLNEFFIPVNIGAFEENVPLLISYKTKIKNNTSIVIEGIETDKDGKAHFILHDENIDSSSRLRIELDISEIKHIFKSKDFPAYQKTVKEFQQIVFKQIINLELKKTQNKEKKQKEKKSSVAIFIEHEGQPISDVEEKLTDILQKMDFKTLPVNSQNLSAPFLIHAKIQFDEVTDAAGGFLVKLKAFIEIKNPGTDEILYKKIITKRGAGFSEKEAHRSASVTVAKTIASAFVELSE